LFLADLAGSCAPFFDRTSSFDMFRDDVAFWRVELRGGRAFFSSMKTYPSDS
jgi:hypothetical protein